MKRITGITLASSLAGAMVLGSLTINAVASPTTGNKKSISTDSNAPSSGKAVGSGGAIQLLRNQAIF
ncbi:hypothetical protein [Zymomonas mobilis]|uniref:Uncharacterized protein n=2 Tax=Zymomonas mobilis TaxID=542 RepID=F8EU28_ZYMMT|nr:hypothetical protein [Zymomonas mobilis]AEI37108.1 hypothetical protein Zymop_0205 [Zymomonas mobilis subsp. pomaceae ATCC 29192]MDX5948479.1 hypothetical protein [Zymomonas mobilis subsp. pomaceae]GEB89456.1 hypothetical protein ZMO02_10930 [Zymomonas mobilis subsp. pomaceae]